MKKSQRIALDFFLSDYPKDQEYKKVLQLIREKDINILIWAVFENCDEDVVVDYIEDLEETIAEAYHESD